MKRLRFSSRVRMLFGLLALMGGAIVHAADGAALRIVTAHLPPLVVEGDPARPGALYELVREMSSRTQAEPRIDFLPWPRAIFMASRQPGTAIFPLTRLPAREPDFRWLVPLYDEHYVFVTPKGSRFNVNRLDDMKHLRVAVIRGAAQATALRARGYHRIVEAKSVDEVHRFMLGGMADAAFGERAIVRDALRTRVAMDQFVVSKPAYTNTAWLAASHDFDERHAASLLRAMQAMRADGTYQKIMAKYQLAD